MRWTRRTVLAGCALTICLAVTGCASVRGGAHTLGELLAGAAKTVKPAEVDALADGFAAGVRNSDDYGAWLSDFKALIGEGDVRPDMRAICATAVDAASDPSADQEAAVVDLSRDLGGVTNLANRFKQDAQKLGAVFSGVGEEQTSTAKQLAYQGFSKLYCRMLVAD